jgi:exosortase A
VHADSAVARGIARSLWQAEWGPLAATAAVMLAVFAVFHDTFFSMAWTWQRSDTFTHGFLVLPIVLFLVWRSRARVASIAPEPAWGGLAVLAVLGFAWLLGELASVQVVSQIAVTLMIPVLLWVAFGAEFVRALAFPMAILLFAVPVGEAFVPKLIEWTADFTVLGLRLSGIPVYQEGNNLVIPSGNWSVVEGCSGIRYLIASMFAGALYAHLTYRSNVRRWVFVGVSIVVPIVANWARAYIIVMLGHLSNNRIAAGVDHLVYGWVFFGLVMLLLFWIGARWREDDPHPPRLAGDGAGAHVVPRFALHRRSVAALAAGAIAAFAWVGVPDVLHARAGPASAHLTPLQPANGWQRAPGRSVPWRPPYQGWSDSLRESFARDGRVVGVFIGYYANQAQGEEMVTSVNQFFPTDDPVWRGLARGTAAVPVGEGMLPVNTGEIRSARHRIAAWQWYWVDGQWTASDYAAKALLARALLLGRVDDSAVIVLHAERDPAPLATERVLEAFARDMLPAIQASLERARGGQK